MNNSKTDVTLEHFYIFNSDYAEKEGEVVFFIIIYFLQLI